MCTSCCLCTIGWENGNYSAFHFSSIHAVMAAGRCWCSQIDGIILLKPLYMWPYLASVLEPSFGFVLYHLQGCHEKLSIIMPRMTNTPPHLPVPLVFQMHIMSFGKRTGFRNNYFGHMQMIVKSPLFLFSSLNCCHSNPVLPPPSRQHPNFINL